jgi:hypothetical protein
MHPRQWALPQGGEVSATHQMMQKLGETFCTVACTSEASLAESSHNLWYGRIVEHLSGRGREQARAFFSPLNKEKMDPSEAGPAAMQPSDGDSPRALVPQRSRLMGVSRAKQRWKKLRGILGAGRAKNLAILDRKQVRRAN